MADRLDGLAAADTAALTAAALKGRIAEVDGQLEDLRRQLAAKESEREFFDAEHAKQDAAYEEAVAALVRDGMDERVVRQVVAVRVQALVASKVEVQLPSPDGRRSRTPATRRPRGRSEPPQGAREGAPVQAGGAAQDEGAPDEQAEAEAPPAPAGEPDGQGGGIVLPMTAGAGDE